MTPTVIISHQYMTNDHMWLSLVLCLSAAVTSTNTILDRVLGTATRPRCSPLRSRRDWEGRPSSQWLWGSKVPGRITSPGKLVVKGIGATTKTPSCLQGGVWDRCNCMVNRRERGRAAKYIIIQGFNHRVQGVVFYRDPPFPPSF